MHTFLIHTQQSLVLIWRFLDLLEVSSTTQGPNKDVNMKAWSENNA